MRPLAVALLGLLAFCGGVHAAEDGACATASSLVHADFPLPHVASAIKKKQLDIVVVGTASSIIAGPAGTKAAYPLRLEAVLAKRLKDVNVKVISYAKPRQSAAEMEKDLERMLTADKPALVLWQTGTFEAVRSTDADAFQAALEEGVDTIRSHDADLIFINMQYSPRTESMIPVATYAEAMRWVSLRHEVPLFDRLAIMRQWYELGTFDLLAATKNTDMAERVHGCIGQLLADLVIDSAKLKDPENKDIR
jgi:hypothetical protein